MNVYWWIKLSFILCLLICLNLIKTFTESFLILLNSSLLSLSINDISFIILGSMFFFCNSKLNIKLSYIKEKHAYQFVLVFCKHQSSKDSLMNCEIIIENRGRAWRCIVYTDWHDLLMAKRRPHQSEAS